MLHPFRSSAAISATFATLFIPTVGEANDSTAAIGIGGLTLTKSENIQMVSEDLFLSLDQVVVKYRFKNVSPIERRVTVAFPLPALTYQPDIPAVTTTEFTFATIVDGSSVTPHVEQKAMLRGNDETNTLHRLGLPLDPYQAADKIRASEVLKAEATQLALVSENGDPSWTLHTAYFWEQVFPATRDVLVEHRYKPALGGAAETPIGSGYFSGDIQRYYQRFCVDQSFANAVTSAAGNHRPGSVFSEQHIAYVLTTGANWKGPINKFRLVVDKGKPEHLVSFCTGSVRQISPTEFEFTASDYVPKSDLFVLVLVRHEPFDETPAAGGDISSLNCDDLWFARNNIFKLGGYCFSTPRATARFGNANCIYRDETRVPLSDADRVRVSDIRKREMELHCSK